MFRFVLALLAVFVVYTEAASISAEDRIVGGRDATIAKHPHQVSLRYKTCDVCPFIHTCGGVIYNEKTIITAAHCVYKREQHDFVIVAGTDYRSGADGSIALVENIVMHEEYNPALTENDIALIFLSTPLSFNRVTIGAATLATNQPKVGSLAVVSGWGTTSEGGANSFKLQEANVNIIDHSDCNEAYGFGRITDNMLCAGVASGGRDACQNDSGGPLMSGNLLVGIVSWGTGCARPEYPGVYVNVANLRNWIESNAQQNS